MRYLVTGGAGFIGSNTVDEIVRRGHEVVVLDDLSTGNAANLAHLKDKITFLKNTITDLGSVRSACHGVDYVIHLAAKTSVPQSVDDPIGTNEVNVNGTLNVLLAAKDAKVRRVVFASSCAVYGDTTTFPTQENASFAPISPYGVSKLIGESYGQMFGRVYGLQFVALRYFNIFGPRQDPSSTYSGVLSLFNAAVLHGTRIKVYGDGEQSRDFTYVGNVVEANLLACEVPAAAGIAVNIGTGKRQTLNQILAALKKIAGTEVTAEYGPPRHGDVRHSQADIGRARSVLGYTAQVQFEDGLRQTWEWFKSSQTTSGR